MAEVLLGQSYFLRFDPKLWQAMEPYPPLGTLVAAAYLRDRGQDVAVFDAMLAPSTDAWRDAVEHHRPRWAVLFEDNFNYLSKMCLTRMREAALRMIADAKAVDARVAVCGSDATDHAGDYLAAGADVVIHGEGEAALAEVLEAAPEAASVENILGISFDRASLDATGADRPDIERTPPRPVMKHLDAMPHAAWDLIDLAPYRRAWIERHGFFSLNMATTRGCPFHCNWCAKPIWGQTYNMRSAGHVANELAYLVERYDPDHIWFADDIFGLKRGWIDAYADELETRDLRLPFKCLSRADLLLRDGEIEALARAGCRIVWIGAESGSQKILDAMEKGTTVEQIRDAARRLREHGVQVGFFLQFGYPGETRNDIDATLELVRDCRPDEIGMSVSYPLPGTKFHQQVESQMGDQRNWVDSEDLAMMYRGPFPTDFYRQLVKVVQKEFRLRAGWRGSRPTDDVGSQRRQRSTVRRFGAIGYHALTLPFERLRLDRLARQPHEGLPPMPTGMSQTDAATPSAQDPS